MKAAILLATVGVAVSGCIVAIDRGGSGKNNYRDADTQRIRVESKTVNGGDTMVDISVRGATVVRLDADGALFVDGSPETIPSVKARLSNQSVAIVERASATPATVYTDTMSALYEAGVENIVIRVVDEGE